MTEEQSLPLARMVSINRVSFWLFVAACMALYVCEWQYNYDLVTSQLVTTNQLIILCLLFTGLTLNVIAAYLKSKTLERNYMRCVYVFEAVSIVVTACLIFLPR